MVFSLWQVNEIAAKFGLLGPPPNVVAHQSGSLNTAARNKEYESLGFDDKVYRERRTLEMERWAAGSR